MATIFLNCDSYFSPHILVGTEHDTMLNHFVDLVNKESLKKKKFVFMSKSSRNLTEAIKKDKLNDFISKSDLELYLVAPAPSTFTDDLEGFDLTNIKCSVYIITGNCDATIKNAMVIPQGDPAEPAEPGELASNDNKQKIMYYPMYYPLLRTKNITQISLFGNYLPDVDGSRYANDNLPKDDAQTEGKTPLYADTYVKSFSHHDHMSSQVLFAVLFNILKERNQDNILRTYFEGEHSYALQQIKNTIKTYLTDKQKELTQLGDTTIEESLKNDEITDVNLYYALQYMLLQKITDTKKYKSLHDNTDLERSLNNNPPVDALSSPQGIGSVTDAVAKIEAAEAARARTADIARGGKRRKSKKSRKPKKSRKAKKSRKVKKSRKARKSRKQRK